MNGRVTVFGMRGLVALALVAGGWAPATPRAQMAAATQMMPAAGVTPDAGVTPAVGAKAKDFALTALAGTTVRLSEQTARGPVVLVVLRGWPGYQCPFCTRQFGEYLAHAADLQATGAQVLFVYPGPADGLDAHAKAFTADRPLPENFHILLDPDYTFTQSYGLRWDAPKETAYPSTFVLDRRGIVTFARTSHAHGERVPVADILKALASPGEV